MPILKWKPKIQFGIRRVDSTSRKNQEATKIPLPIQNSKSQDPPSDPILPNPNGINSTMNNTNYFTNRDHSPTPYLDQNINVPKGHIANGNVNRNGESFGRQNINNNGYGQNNGYGHSNRSSILHRNEGDQGFHYLQFDRLNNNRSKSPRNVRFEDGVGSSSVPATPNSQRRQPQTYQNANANRALTATVTSSPPHALPPAYNPNRSTPQPIPMNIVGAETLSGHISDSGISRHSEYVQRQPSPLTVNGRSNGYHSDYGALPGKRTPILGRDNGHLSDDMSKEYVPPRPPRQQYGSYAQNSASERAQQIINTVNANPKNRANAILQQLRSDDGALSESDMSTNEFPYQRLPIPPQRNSSSNVLNPKGVVYLEFNKEVKRSALPMKIYSLEQIKSLFLRSFPALNLQFLNQEHVKIYISDRNSTGDNVLFYELEDLNDIRDQCVLKIHQNQATRNGPAPVRFTDALPTDYISEPEMLDDRSGRYASYRGPNRPSSVVPSDQARYPIYGSIQNGGRKSSNMLSSSHYEPYYDPYYSDSSQGPRSGSATPVIDKETRYRVENMEKQLSDLSNMVRHALHKDQSEDMVDIGRRLMEMRSDATRLTKSNRPVEKSPPFNSSNLKAIQRNAANLQSGLAELKESLRMDALARSDILRDTFSRLNHRITLFAAQKEREIADFKAQAGPSQEDSVLEGQKDEHIRSVAQLEETIQNLEDRIEERRVSVLSKNQKLRMNEVEELAAQVNGLDQQTDSLKAEFQNLEEDVNRHLNKYRDEIAKDMEFLRREPINLENFQRRCAALQNMLQTMRKLALVQDPAMYDRNKAALNGGPKFSVSNGNGNNGHNRQDLPPLPNPNRIPSPKPSRLNIPPPPPPPSTSIPPIPQSPRQNINPPKPAPLPPSITSSTNSANVLDSILDELNHTANSLPNIDQVKANGQVEGSPPKSPVKSPQKKQQFRIAENNGGTGGNKQNGVPEKASAVDQRRRVDNVGSRIQTRPMVPTSVQRTIILPKNT
ncbi:unnamed protein product [Bursaphelenchus xylophilus]|uniref:(pine wood nematode) hypothetical protein n=1 Tax=Bursaphelenchus xylophilus TaxID=6326 RepID=A0A1I7RZX7_BURXY|nr:unnamed protein product [Bursaphelenchus xylophilus]CAG9109162.1 unnamed protein product [Bursaphelenchus xylophilus]